jgi:polar amino acid transport system substrate-binding protein
MHRRGAIVGIIAWRLVVGAADARDLADIRKDGVLRVLVVPDARVREFVDLDTKARPGFDIEILQGFARAQKLELRPVSLTGWDKLLPALLKDEGDVIAGCFTNTEARRRHIQFTQPVFPTGTVVVTRKPHRVVNTLEELREEKVGTIRGTSMEDALATVGMKGKLDYAVLEQKDLSAALRSREITAVAWGLEGAIAAANHDHDLQVGMMLGPPTALAYGVRKEDTELLAALNAQLSMLRKTGVWQRLVVRYLGTSAPRILKGTGDTP